MYTPAAAGQIAEGVAGSRSGFGFIPARVCGEALSAYALR